ncbi:MAG: YaaA family protein [Rhodothermia bacterium]|nr:YaaA family protein [Rhodothermia bacterium]
MSGFCLLIPPAEGKASGGTLPNGLPHPFDGGFSMLHQPRQVLYNQLCANLKRASGLDKLFGVKGKALLDAVLANEEVQTGRLLPVLDRYAPGVMYRALDFAQVLPNVQLVLLENTIVFSGLFGLLRLDDLIPLYKLKMEAVLWEFGRVSAYWKPILSPILNREVAHKTVWDLLPTAHQAAWEDGGTYRYRVQCAFMEEKNGNRKPVSHGVKPLRGELIRYLAEHRISTPEDLQFWKPSTGFRMDPGATRIASEGKKMTLVFVK